MKVSTDSCILGAWTASQINPSAKKILDIGSGTGLLMLMIAQQSSAFIYGIEKDIDAFAQGTQNITESKWAERLFNDAGDAREFISPDQFDFIICNPPFHDNQLKGPMQEKNLAHHSTALTLEELISTIKTLLIYSGKFAVLIPCYRMAELLFVAASQHYYPEKKLLIHSSSSHPPFRTIILFSNDISATSEEEKLFIRDDNGNYTDEFKQLLGDYYLHL